MDGDGNVEDESKAVNIDDLHGGAADDDGTNGADHMHKLCMWVYAKDHDDSMAIMPGSYYVTPDYKATGTTQAMTPDGMESMIGSIERDGTTVRLPYLTTHEAYSQRIVIVNNGSRDADYMFEFTTEEGVTATAGSDADGMVTGGQALSLDISDVVTLIGGNRVAATLIVEANRRTIDVATNQVNRDRGTTDTVTYEPEM